MLECNSLSSLMLLALCPLSHSKLTCVHVVPAHAHMLAQSSDMWLREGCECRREWMSQCASGVLGSEVPQSWGRRPRSTPALSLSFLSCNGLNAGFPDMLGRIPGCEGRGRLW